MSGIPGHQLRRLAAAVVRMVNLVQGSEKGFNQRKQNLVVKTVHDFGRQAGRTGVGTVMGSKKLKAIAIKGTNSLKVANPKKLMKIAKQAFKDCLKHPMLKLWQRQGTASVTEWANEQGAFPTRNFQSGFFKDHKNISGDVMEKETVVTNKACFGCPMACGKYAKVNKNGKEYYVEGPEYDYKK